MTGMDYYQAMCEVSQHMNSSMDASYVLRSMAECVARAVNAKAASVMLLSEDRCELVHVAAWGLSERYLKKGPVGTDVVVSIMAEGRPVAILDVMRDIRIRYRDQASSEGISSIATMPIWQGGQVSGVLAVYSATPREFMPEEFDFLGAVANLVAVELERRGRAVGPTTPQ